MKSLIILLSAFTLLTNLEIVSSDLASFLDRSPILVLADGEDKPECGDMEGMSGCKTIAHACGLGANPREIVVGAGIFIEEVGIMVEGSLTVTGQSTGGCVLSKTSSPFMLFNVSAAGADLMLAHMTVLLVSHAAQGSFVWCADGNETVYVAFRGCRFTGQSGTESGDGRSVSVAISGQCVYIDNPEANLLIDGCTVYNITCTQFSFIYCVHVAALQITKSSFANVHNTNRTGSGGCFYLEHAIILNLRLSFFVGCGAIESGGVGCAQGLTESGSAISSCAFWNGSATFGGVLEILSSSFDSTLDIANISCTYCIARLDGGALVFDNLKFAISFSTFRKCTCARCGGAVAIIGQSLVEITRCVFANCRSSGTESGDGGGALYMSGSTATLKYIVFVENEASKGSDMFLILMIQVDIPSECYSDKVEALSLSCTSACPVGIIYASTYASVTCRFFITNNLPYDGERCAMPCSGSLSADSTTTTCTLLCRPNYVSVNGACVPECEFWTGADGTADSNETDVCGPLCVRDTSHGYPLCGSAVACAGQNLVRPEVAGGGCQLRECADRTIGTGAGIDTDTDANASTDTVAEMLSALPLPCGSEDCFRQINIAGENLRTCDLACPRTYAYASSSPDSGTCLLLQCSKRTVDSNTTVDFPCGSDCFVDSPHPGGGGRKRNCTEGECTRPDLYERDARSGYCVEKDDPGTETNTSTGDGEDGEDERKHPRGLSTGHMIIVVVVPISAVAVVAIGIIIFFLVRWRKRKDMSFSSSSSSRELFPQENVTNLQAPS